LRGRRPFVELGAAGWLSIDAPHFSGRRGPRYRAQKFLYIILKIVTSMTIATGVTRLVWKTNVQWVRSFYPMPAEKREAGMPEMAAEELPEDETLGLFGEVWECFVVVFPPGDERIRFRVNHRQGRGVTFTDPCDRTAGTAGTTGLWGTLPPPRAVKPRPLTLIEFRAELAQLIGAEKADEIINSLVKKFRPSYDSCQIY
jgi:hypothetical protein